MLLYHYTDQNGFMGIINNSELWATKIQYLNDSKEFYLAITLANDILDEMVAKEKDEKIKLRISRFISNLSGIRNLNLCVCSLSEEGDLLSQWRGYSKQHGGYSIGFDSDALALLLSSQGFRLGKCVYDKEAQIHLVADVINKSLTRYQDMDEPDPEFVSYASDSAQYFIKELSLIAPLIKDISFSEEKEWRILSEGGITFGNLRFRAGISMLIPYYGIRLKPDFWNLIRQVIVGHTPHPELAHSSTRAFLIGKFREVSKTMPPFSIQPDVAPVKNSSIPYRSW
ncbi:DUF2971 domain-containing protein [Enterobacter kobei]|nr:DUF2971 domain-containing protein [Enterobacter kobei]